MAPKNSRGEKAEWRVVGDKAEAKQSESGAAEGSRKGSKKEGGKGKRGGKGKEAAEEAAASWSKHEEEEDGSRRKPAKGKGRKGGSKSQAQAEDNYGDDDGYWGKGWSSGWDTGWDGYGSWQGGNSGEKPKRGNKGGGKRDAYSAVDYPQGPTGGEEDYYEGYDYGYSGGYGYPYGPDSWQQMPQVEPAPPPPPPKKSEWTEYKTPEGDVYYHSSRTGLTQWERPPELDPPKPVEPDPVPQGFDKSDADVGHSGKGGGRGRGRGDDHDRDDQRKGGGGGDGGARRNRDGGGDAQQRKTGRGGASKRHGGSMPKDQDASDFGPPGCNLFVFHLPDDWVDDDLHEYFAPHGSVVSAKVMKELGTGRSRGFGFVSYEDRVSAATAIKKMQGYKILGKRLKVEFKKGEMDGGSVQDGQTDLGQEEDSGAPKKSYPDDERLIGYLRAISAKNVVTALKESENPESGDASGAMDPVAADTEDAGFSMGGDDAAEDAES